MNEPGPENYFTVISGKTHVSLDNIYKFDFEDALFIMEDYKKKLKKAINTETDKAKKDQFKYLLESLRLEPYKEH